MKILLIASQARPLAEQAALALSERGHDVVALEGLRIAGDEIGSKYISAHNAGVLLAQLGRFAPGVAYLHDLTGAGGLSLLACLEHQGVPWVWHLTDPAPYHICSSRALPARCLSEEGWGATRPELARWFSRELSGAFLVSSSRLAAEIAGHGIDLGGRVSLVAPWFSQRYERKPGGGRIRIGSPVSRESEAVVRAAAQLGHDFDLELFGPNPSPLLQALIDSLGLRPRARVTARPSRSWDLFLVPSGCPDTLGSMALEAAAGGCVPIVPGGCGLAEWLVDGVHCLKGQEALAGVLRGEVDLGKLAARVSEAVRTDFHISAHIDRVEAILQEAAGRPRRARGSAEEALRLAQMAEKTVYALAKEAP